MESKVLLKLIKDDLKLLDEINKSFIAAEKLTREEVAVALTRAKSLVAEFESLSRNIVEKNEDIIIPEPQTERAIKEDIRFSGDRVDLPDQDSALIDLEEEEVRKDEPEESIPMTIAEEPAAEGKQVLKEKAEEMIMPVRPAMAAVQGDLFDEPDQNNSHALDGKFEGQRQMIQDLLAKERPGISFEEVPLKSMKDGMGINDRYLFIRELFGDEPEKFEETVAAIDGFSEIEEAVDYLKQHFKWSKSEAGQKFLNLVKRRFRQ